MKFHAQSRWWRGTGHGGPALPRGSNPLLFLTVLSLAIFPGCVTTPAPYPEGPAKLDPPETGTEGFETPPTFAAADVLPPELVSGPYHRVVDPVVNDGFTNHYLIHSDFGVYRTTGLDETRLVVNELHAIAALQDIERSKARRDGFRRGVKSIVFAPVRQIRGIIRNPLRLIVIVPSTVVKPIGLALQARVFVRHGPTVRTVKEFVGYSNVKRRIAAEHGVNPESENPVLQYELESITQASFSGQVPARVADGFVPGLPIARFHVVDKGASLASGVDTAMSASQRQSMHNKLWRMDLSAADIKAFKKSGSLSKPQKRALVDALYTMDSVEGRPEVILLATRINSRPASQELVRQTRIMADYHREVEPLLRLLPHDPLLLCYTQSQVLMLAFSGDYLAWTRDVALITERLPDICPPDLSISRREVWLAGDASSRFRAECGNMQFAVNGDSTTVLAAWDVKQRVALMRSGGQVAVPVLLPSETAPDTSRTLLASN